MPAGSQRPSLRNKPLDAGQKAIHIHIKMPGRLAKGRFTGIAANVIKDLDWGQHRWLAASVNAT